MGIATCSEARDSALSRSFGANWRGYGTALKPLPCVHVSLGFVDDAEADIAAAPQIVVLAETAETLAS
jgi:hypothetical protein